jgi:hypothetical protein
MNNLFRLILSILDQLSGGYKPELHYMRGPGPKWHEKHDSATSSVR